MSNLLSETSASAGAPILVENHNNSESAPNNGNSGRINNSNDNNTVYQRKTNNFTSSLSPQSSSNKSLNSLSTPNGNATPNAAFSSQSTLKNSFVSLSSEKETPKATQNNNENRKNIRNSESSSALMKLKTYLLALRPWSLSGSLVPTILGSALAYRSQWAADFNFITFFLTIFTVVTVHCAGNVVNTYFDFIKGIDNRKSDDRTLVDHILTKDEVVSLGAILYMAGCIGFICLAVISPAKMEHLALIYFGGLSSSFLYTGGIGFKYIALGDLAILILFGPLSVLFAFMSQTGHVNWTTIYFAIPLALNSEAILHSNNTRDAENDMRAGIVTLAILIGRTASHVLYALLLFTPYSIFVVLAVKYSLWFLLPLITLPQAFKIEKLFRCETTMSQVPRQTAKLNFFFGILYVVACCCAEQLPTLSNRRY